MDNVVNDKTKPMTTYFRTTGMIKGRSSSKRVEISQYYKHIRMLP